MPSFAISQFIILLEPLWVSAVFLLLSTGPLSYIIQSTFLEVTSIMNNNIDVSDVGLRPAIESCNNSLEELGFYTKA